MSSGQGFDHGSFIVLGSIVEDSSALSFVSVRQWKGEGAFERAWL